MKQVQRGIGDDPQPAGRQRPRFGEKLQRPVLDLEQPVGDFEQPLSGFGDGDLLLPAIEQEDVVLFLKFANLIGYRRLGKRQSFGGARKTAVNRHIVKGSKLNITHEAPPFPDNPIRSAHKNQRFDLCKQAGDNNGFALGAAGAARPSRRRTIWA